MIRGFLRGSERYFIAAALLGCAASFLEMLRPKVIQYTVDQLLTDVRVPLYLPALAVIGCTLISALFRYGYEIDTVTGSEIFVKTMRDQLFDHIQHLGMDWHNSHRTGDIIQRCTSDVEEIKTFLSEHLVKLVSTIITLTLAIVFILRIDWMMGIIAFLGIPVQVGFSMWFHDKISTGFLSCDEQEGVLSAMAQENLTGVRVVRAFGREQWEQERFRRQNHIVTRQWISLGKSSSVFFALTDLLTGGLVAVLIIAGSVRCVQGILTVGGLMAVLSYMMMLVRPIRGLGRTLSEMSKTTVAVTRLREIMEAPLEEEPGKALTPELDQDITFDHVSFSYPGKSASGEDGKLSGQKASEILQDVSFCIPAGTTLGILGSTGSGKSTLMELLCRLYPLSEEQGSIRIGNVDIRDIRGDWLRSGIGYVLQDSFLFSKTIRENITLGKPELSMKHVREAAKAACLDRVVDGFAKGYDTIVGERGMTLSGGQKQRTAIARTLAGQRQILIFDDSLSAVDAQTDEEIRRNLRSYMGKATIILISHRIQTLMDADQILVLEHGQIVDQGTHEELRSRPGLYQRICEIQEGGADHE